MGISWSGEKKFGLRLFLIGIIIVIASLLGSHAIPAMIGFFLIVAGLAVIGIAEPD